MARYIPGILFHRLTGTPGWTEMSSRTSFDVSSITDVYIKKRWFCITDRDKPYTVCMTVYEPEKRVSIAPGVGPGGITMSFYYKTKTHQDVTARYKTMKDAEADVEEIEKKKRQLLTIAQRLSDMV